MPFPKGYNPWEHRKKKADAPQPPNVQIEIKSVTIVPALTPEQQKDTIKRHTVGLMGAVESLYGAVLTPKCRVCFDAHGWLTKCKCEKK